MPAIFDQFAFLQMLDNDEELLREILGYYLEDSGRLVTELAIALAEGATERAGCLAHTLKGASANVHANRVREAALQLETAIWDATPAGQGQLLANVVQYRHELVAHLCAERPELAHDLEASLAGYPLAS